MSLFDKLRLLDLINDGKVTTHLGHDPETGRRHLLHWFPQESDPSFASINGMLAQLPELSRQAIRETGSRDGRTYLITDELPGFASLEDWLHSARNRGESTAGSAEASRRKEAPAIPISSGLLPGEFTQLIQTSAAVRSAASAPHEQPMEPPTLPGEFTRLMHPPPAGQPPAGDAGQNNAQRTVRGVQRPSGRAGGLPEPGEFTRLMQSRPLSQQGGQDPVEPFEREGERKPSELTGLTTPSGIPAQESPQRPSLAGLPEPAPPGEFTRMFRQPAANSTPLLPGEDPFRQSFRSQAAPERPIGRLENGLFDRPGSTHPDKRLDGPSEYTRLFSPPPVNPEQQSPSPLPPTRDDQAASEARNSTASSLWLAGGALAFLAVVAIILIVYFALKK